MNLEDAFYLSNSIAQSLRRQWSERFYNSQPLQAYSSDPLREYQAAVARSLQIPSVGVSWCQDGDIYKIAVRLRKYDQVLLLQGIEAYQKAQSNNQVDVGILLDSRIHKKRRDLSTWDKVRPLQPGVSIGSSKRLPVGTLGCFVHQHDHGDHVFILSNNHVLADQNNLPIGTPIIQPGLGDGGSTRLDKIAHLTEYVKLELEGNEVDAAIAQITGDTDFTPTFWYPLSSEVVPADEILPGMIVIKTGRSTGITRGVVTATELVRVPIAYGFGSQQKYRTFDQVIEIEGIDGAFSQGGDSGSLIISQGGRPLALLFAGGTVSELNGAKRTVTYACPIQTVLERLNLDIISGPARSGSINFITSVTI